jgi:hypothetical protein
VNRHCCRSGCVDPAIATLSYHYAVGQAWLDDLAPEKDPHGYDMCARHSARVTVPHGWTLEDRRARAEARRALRAG